MRGKKYLRNVALSNEITTGETEKRRVKPGCDMF